jgi:hypothetical protein
MAAALRRVRLPHDCNPSALFRKLLGDPAYRRWKIAKAVSGQTIAKYDDVLRVAFVTACVCNPQDILHDSAYRPLRLFFLAKFSLVQTARGKHVEPIVFFLGPLSSPNHELVTVKPTKANILAQIASFHQRNVALCQKCCSIQSAHVRVGERTLPLTSDATVLNSMVTRVSTPELGAYEGNYLPMARIDSRHDNWFVTLVDELINLKKVQMEKIESSNGNSKEKNLVNSFSSRWQRL